MRIVEQCLARIPTGPVVIEDSRFVLPPTFASSPYAHAGTCSPAFTSAGIGTSA